MIRMNDINEEIIKALTINGEECPIYYIIKPDGIKHDMYLTFNWSKYPARYANDRVLSYEVCWTYNFFFHKSKIKEALRFARMMRKRTGAELVVNDYNPDTNYYFFAYEGNSWEFWE